MDMFDFELWMKAKNAYFKYHAFLGDLDKVALFEKLPLLEQEAWKKAVEK